MQLWVIIYRRVNKHHKISTEDLRKVFISRALSLKGEGGEGGGGVGKNSPQPTTHSTNICMVCRTSAPQLRRRRKAGVNRYIGKRPKDSKVSSRRRRDAARFRGSAAHCAGTWAKYNANKRQTSSQETAGERRSSPENGSLRESCWCLKDRGTSICVFSFSPQGLKASLLMPPSTRLHAHPLCTVSMMDCASAWVRSNRNNNNAAFLFTEVIVISVSTKQMS